MPAREEWSPALWWTGPRGTQGYPGVPRVVRGGSGGSGAVRVGRGPPPIFTRPPSSVRRDIDAGALQDEDRTETLEQEADQRVGRGAELRAAFDARCFNVACRVRADPATRREGSRYISLPRRRDSKIPLPGPSDPHGHPRRKRISAGLRRQGSAPHVPTVPI